MIRALVAAGNTIEMVISGLALVTVIYTMVTVGVTPALVLMGVYALALIALHAASAYYAMA